MAENGKSRFLPPGEQGRRGLIHSKQSGGASLSPGDRTPFRIHAKENHEDEGVALNEDFLAQAHRPKNRSNFAFHKDAKRGLFMGRPGQRGTVF